MSLEVYWDEHRPVVELGGVLDRESVPGIRKVLLRLVKAKGIKDLRIDLAEVDRMDTSGVAMLVEVLRVLSARKGKVHLTNPSEAATRMIRLARLNGVFEQGASGAWAASGAGQAVRDSRG